MQFRLDVYHHVVLDGDSLADKVDNLTALVQGLAVTASQQSTMLQEEVAMNQQIDDGLNTLTQDTAKLTDTVTSANALLTGLSGQLAAAIQAAKDAGATPAELQQLTDLHTAFSSQTDALAAAIAANTPADPNAGGGSTGGSTGGTDAGNAGTGDASGTQAGG